jgi:hypothetical protein
LAGSLPSVVLMAIWKLIAPPDSWLSLTAVILTGGVLTGTCGWFMSLTPIERQRLLRVLKRDHIAPAVQNGELPPI